MCFLDSRASTPNRHEITNQAGSLLRSLKPVPFILVRLINIFQENHLKLILDRNMRVRWLRPIVPDCQSLYRTQFVNLEQSSRRLQGMLIWWPYIGWINIGNLPEYIFENIIAVGYFHHQLTLLIFHNNVHNVQVARATWAWWFQDIITTLGLRGTLYGDTWEDNG